MDAYIVAGFRSAIGKSHKGTLKSTLPTEFGAQVLKHLMKNVPNVKPEQIDDLIVGCSNPEAEQGLNMGRHLALQGLGTDKVPGETVNRFCSSGLDTIALASAKINAGMANCIIAGGVESMSLLPFSGWKVAPDPKVAKSDRTNYWSMGLTAEAVANEYKVSREEQDAFAVKSHEKSLKAIADGTFKDDIAPITITETYLDENEKKKTREIIFDTDEGPRPGTSAEGLAKLRAVFAQGGSVTAGNSSQTSDGAAFVMVCNKQFVEENNLKPIARLVTYAVAGVPPRIMGIGPIYSIPKALEQAGMTLDQIDQIELNEAFASQSVAIIKELGIDPEKVNVNGGAISLGHPLGCTGAKLTVQLLNEMRRRKQKYGMVTMCVGTGQGATGIFELLD